MERVSGRRAVVSGHIARLDASCRTDGTNDYFDANCTSYDAYGCHDCPVGSVAPGLAEPEPARGRLRSPS